MSKNTQLHTTLPRWLTPEAVSKIRSYAAGCFAPKGGKLVISSKEASDDLLADLAGLRHHGGLNKGCTLEQLADVLGERSYNAAQVSRLLDEAEERGIVKVSIHPKGGSVHESVVAEYGLRRISICESNSKRGALLRNLGRQAAELFGDLYTELGSMHVALGGGRTMHAMVDAMEPVDRSLTVSPLVFFTRIESNDHSRFAMTDAPFIATAMAWKHRASANVCAIPPLPEEVGGASQRFSAAREFTATLFKMSTSLAAAFEEACAARVIFTSVATVGDDETLRPTYERVGISPEVLREKGCVGHLNFTAFDEKGVDVSTPLAEELGITGFREDCHPFVPAVAFSAMHRAAKENDRFVVLVAGGTSKYHAIKAALRAGVCNCLVTDTSTVQRLAKELCTPVIKTR